MKILVLGDRIQDFYVFGSVGRMCPEAPVPVFVAERNECRDGGAALVAANLRALGAEVVCHYGSYSEKMRFYAGNHLLLRIDDDSCALDQYSLQNGRAESKMSTTGLINACQSFALEDALAVVSAVVVSDYGKGAISHEMARAICLNSKVPVFVDAKRNWDSYAGSFAAFPNENENTLPAFHEHIIQKLGARGCSVDGALVPTNHRKVYDVTGAGDVFLAAFVFEYVRTGDLMKAARFANECAGMSVEHLGSYVIAGVATSEPARS